MLVGVIAEFKLNEVIIPGYPGMGFDVVPVFPLPEIIKPMIGALFVGIIAIFFPQVMGNGYEFIEKALLNDMTIGLMFILIFLKILATTCG